MSFSAERRADLQAVLGHCEQARRVCLGRHHLTGIGPSGQDHSSHGRESSLSSASFVPTPIRPGSGPPPPRPPPHLLSPLQSHSRPARRRTWTSWRWRQTPLPVPAVWPLGRVSPARAATRLYFARSSPAPWRPLPDTCRHRSGPTPSPPPQPTQSRRVWPGSRGSRASVTILPATSAATSTTSSGSTVPSDVSVRGTSPRVTIAVGKDCVPPRRGSMADQLVADDRQHGHQRRGHNVQQRVTRR